MAPTQNDIENASVYLEKHNFKTLVEWFTAEVILNRPSDPLAFLRKCVEEKLDERGDEPYHPSQFLEYAKDCYAQATKSADETGKLGSNKSDASDAKKPSSRKISSDLQGRVRMLENVLGASREISSHLDPMEATHHIVKHACDLLNCDRATIFKLDKKKNVLELMVAKGAKQIFLPVGQGIAGSVVASGKITNIPDAYADERFSDEHDRSTGYLTKSILASPVRDLGGNIVGVIQAINRKGADQEEKDSSGFTEKEEEVLGYLANHVGSALTNATLYHHMFRSEEKVRSLLDIIHAMHDNLGINSLMFTITQRAHTLVEADRCTMFLLDESSQELWSLQGEVNLRIPMDKGIAGECCTSNKTINIPDAYADDRFNQEVDKKSGYKTETILCMPCRDNDGNVVGVIQLINKAEGVFDEEDEEIMDSFLIIAGPVLARSQLFQRHKVDDESSTEFSGKDVTKRNEHMIPQQAAIKEGEGEEDEE